MRQTGGEVWLFMVMDVVVINATKRAIKDYIEKKDKKYLTQMHLTTWAAGLKACYLVVKDRSACKFWFNDKIGGLRYQLDTKLVGELLNKFAMITRMVKSGDAPIREHTKGSKECGYCDFRHHCWKENE